jgi:hypothetical protein
MALLTPAISYTAQQDRAGVLGAMFGREGVYDLIGGHLKVTQRAAGANFTVDVAAGRAAIMGDDISDQGTYVVTTTTTVNVTVPAKPASGTRTHRVIARIRDKLANGSWTTYDWTIELLADTGTGIPALPPSAISLASIAVSSSAASVTNSMITDLRARASVGTPAVSGTFAVRPDGYSASDVSRPPQYSVNPDGWVVLGGWISRSAATLTINAGTTLYDLTTTPLPASVLPSPATYRDTFGISSEGFVQYTVRPNGQLAFRFFETVTLTKDVSWFSFDGCGWKL